MAYAGRKNDGSEAHVNQPPFAVSEICLYKRFRFLLNGVYEINPYETRDGACTFETPVPTLGTSVFWCCGAFE